MPDGNESLRNAVHGAAQEQADALASIAAAMNDTADEAEVDAPSDDTPSIEAPDGGESDVPPEATRDEPEAQDGDSSEPGEGEPQPTEGTGEDVPMSYFGQDLSDLEPEARARVIGVLKEQDKVINRLMQRTAELEQGPQAPNQPEPQPQAADDGEPTEVSDEDILAAFGLDTDDPMFEVKKEVLLPVARRQFEMEQVVRELSEERAANQALDFWNHNLDALESEHGALVGPDGEAIPRERVLEYAVENNIGDPTAVYHAFAAPARQVQTAALAAKQEALRKLKQQQAGAVRPKGSAAGPKQTIDTDDLAAAMRQAAQQAEKEAGVTWRQALPEVDA